MNVNTILQKAVVALIMFGAATSLAGGWDTGGGDVIICTDLDQNGKLVRTPYLADTFDIVRNGNREKFSEYEKYAVDRYWLVFLNLLNSISKDKTLPHPHIKGEKVSYPWMVEYYKHRQDLNYVDEVPELDDDNIDLEKYPENCREKKQLAVQHLKTGVIDTNIKLLFQLTLFERVLFGYHEVRVGMRNRAGEDTTTIRKSILNLLKDERMTLKALSHELAAKVIRARNPALTQEEKDAIHRARVLDHEFKCVDQFGPYRGGYRLNRRQFIFYKVDRSDKKLSELSEQTIEGCLEYYQIQYDLSGMRRRAKRYLKVLAKIPEATCHVLRNSSRGVPWHNLDRFHIKEISEGRYALSFTSIAPVLEGSIDENGGTIIVGSDEHLGVDPSYSQVTVKKKRDFTPSEVRIDRQKKYRLHTYKADLNPYDASASSGRSSGWIGWVHDRKDVTLFFNKYIPRTNQLFMSLQVKNEGEDHTKPYTHFGAVCYASKLDFK